MTYQRRAKLDDGFGIVSQAPNECRLKLRRVAKLHYHEFEGFRFCRNRNRIKLKSTRGHVPQNANLRYIRHNVVDILQPLAAQSRRIQKYAR